MASDAEWAIGDAIEYGDGATPSENFAEIAELKNIQFNLGTRTKVDTTHHQSTPPYRDKLATFLEDGQITADCNWLPHNQSHMDMESKLGSTTPSNFRYVVHADDGDVVFAGQAFVTSFPHNSPFDNARTGNVVLEMTGAWPRVRGS